MSRRGGIAILALVCFALAGCGDPPGDPESEIGLMIDAAASAAQAGDLETLQAFVSPDYADEEGRDRRAAGFLLRSLLGRYPNVLVSVSNLRIQLISSELATAAGADEVVWEAADLLRSNMDPAEYKHVVLGFIFLNYIILPRQIFYLSFC